jgi:GNAT superfamily N-acetyltransferase
MSKVRQLHIFPLIKDSKQIGNLVLACLHNAPPRPRDYLRHDGCAYLPQTRIEIRELSVIESERGEGYGDTLLHLAITRARHSQLILTIDVPTVRNDVRRWLRSWGFQERIFWRSSQGIPFVMYDKR